MDYKKKYDQFFEQVKDKPLPLTATSIMNAIKGNGYTPELEPVYLAIADASGAVIKAELANFTNAQETARQEKAIQETMASLAEKSGAFTVEIDHEKRKELIEGIRRAAASLGTVENKIFPTLSEVIAEWDAYNPEKDFMPPLLAGAAIKDGTLTYIGARTNVGKTTALISIAREALAVGRKVVFLTLEEPTRDILRKLILCNVYATSCKEDREILQTLAQEKGDLTADFHAARKGGYVKGDKDTAVLFKRLVQQAQEYITGYYGNRLVFCEGRSIKTLEETAAAVTKHAGTGDIILVDYIQRLKGPEGTDYTNYMRGKAQSEALFTFAKNTGTVVISGGQFNRATKDIPRELAPFGFKPFDETCFRETGDIEQDGDYIFGIGEGMDIESAKRFIKTLKVRSGSGRGRCYEIDFQGAFNYMGIGGRLTKMNPVYIGKPGKKTAAPPADRDKESNGEGTGSNFDWNTV
jgi:hypothetical protein